MQIQKIKFVGKDTDDAMHLAEVYVKVTKPVWHEIILTPGKKNEVTVKWVD